LFDFYASKSKGADRINEILDSYNRGLGQLVNKHKSAIFFSANCGDSDKREVHQALAIPTEALGKDTLAFRRLLAR
jgi:hypothetical protein